MTSLDWVIIPIFVLGMWRNGKALRRIARKGMKSETDALLSRAIDYALILVFTNIVGAELGVRDYVVIGVAVGVLGMCCAEVFLINRWLDSREVL